MEAQTRFVKRAILATGFSEGVGESLRIECTIASPVDVEGTGIASEPQPKKRRILPGNTDRPASPAVAEVSRSGSETVLAHMEGVNAKTEMNAMKDTEADQATEAVYRINV